MALSAVLPSIDSLPDAIKAEYKAGEGDFDGLFVLDVTGANGLTLGNTEKIHTALEKERVLHKEAAKKLSLYKYDGEDLSADAAIAALKKLKEFKPENADEIQKLFEETMKAEFGKKETALIDKFTNEANLTTEENNKLRSQLHHEILTSKTVAILSEKAPKHVDLLRPHLEGQLSIEENDGKLAVVIKNADGGTKLSKIAGTGTEPMGLSELVDEMSKDERYSMCFAGSGAEGSGASGGTGSNSHKSDDLSGMSPEQKLAHIRS